MLIPTAAAPRRLNTVLGISLVCIGMNGIPGHLRNRGISLLTGNRLCSIMPYRLLGLPAAIFLWGIIPALRLSVQGVTLLLRIPVRCLLRRHLLPRIGVERLLGIIPGIDCLHLPGIGPGRHRRLYLLLRITLHTLPSPTVLRRDQWLNLLRGCYITTGQLCLHWLLCPLLIKEGKLLTCFGICKKNKKDQNRTDQNGNIDAGGLLNVVGHLSQIRKGESNLTDDV